MRYIRIVAAVVLALSGLQAAAQTTEPPPTNPFAGTGDLVMQGDAADYITGGKSWHASASDGTWASNVMDETKSGIPDRVRITFSATGTPKAGVGSSWGLDFGTDKVPGDLLVGTYTDAQRASFADPGRPGLDVSGDGRGCNTVTGTFTITAIDFDCVASGPSVGLLHLTNFAATFEQHCEGGTPANRGTVTFKSPPGVACDSGSEPTPTPLPPPPPPDALVGFPSTILESGLAMTNDSTQTVTISTITQNGFSGDVDLEVVSDATDVEGVTATLSNTHFAAPGIGQSTLTIKVGPNTFPRDYFITVITNANGKQAFNTIKVIVLCDPPMILGIDQPRGTSVSGSGSASLETKVVGSGPLTYQWYSGPRGSTNFPVSGANGAKLTTSNEGLYWVRVSNACGSVDSVPALVSRQ